MASQEQLDDIKTRLDTGQTPTAIAQFLGRVADLDLDEIEELRDIAGRLERGETVPAGEPL